MGAANSTDRIERPFEPLQAQESPFSFSSHSLVSTAPTTLRLVCPDSSGVIQVFDDQRSELLFQIKPSTWRNPMVIYERADGTPILSFRKKFFGEAYRVYEGAEKKESRHLIEGRRSLSGLLLVLHEFHDQTTGRHCRLLFEPTSHSTIYLERGSPNLSTVESRDNTLNLQYQPVGRIQIKEQQLVIEAAVGVDLTMLVLMWQARKLIEEAAQAAARAGAAAGVGAVTG